MLRVVQGKKLKFVFHVYQEMWQFQPIL